MLSSLRLFISVVVAALSVSCEATFPTQPTADITDWRPPAPVTSIELFHIGARSLIAVGSTFSYQAFAVHADGVYEPIGNSAVTWTSSNPAVVRQLGPSLQAFGPGTAEIAARYQSFSASVTATVVSALPYPRVTLQPGIPPDLIRLSTVRALHGETVRCRRGRDGARHVGIVESAVATVEAGQVRATGQGTSEISASYNGMRGFYYLSITDVADRVALDPFNPGAVYRAGGRR